MDALERRLCLAGLGLFVLGLALGFAVKAFPNPRVALSAHLNAVQSGTFLVALGLLWPKLAVWRAAASPLANVIWVSFWLLEAGMVLSALARPAAGAPGPLKVAAGALLAVSSVAMILALAVLLFTFRPRAG